MEFELTEEQKIFQKAIRDFAENEIDPLVEEAEEKEEFPVELFPKMGRLGYLGFRIPHEYGGTNAGLTIESIAVEEMSRICVGIATAFISEYVLLPLISKFGTEEQKERYLTPAVKGEKICAYAITEPNAGSDVKAIESNAHKDTQGYIINGSKMFITNGGIADFIIVVAYVDRSKGISGMSNFIVDKGTPGISVKKLRKVGSRSANTVEISLVDCRIPHENIIGGEEGGFKRVMDTFNPERVIVGARSVGLAEAAYEASLKYAKERTQFGQPIGKFQAISFKLTDMATNIEAARLLVYQAAWLHDQGKRFVQQASMAKLFAGEMAQRVASEAMQIHGGYGIMSDCPVQRYLRDTRSFTVGAGTSEIQRLILAKEIGL